jgi:glycosyltransferase involved in cell wall biosynthesis
METLSVVIITLNEEKNIEACLASVAWADELVVLDSGSTDGTEAICRRYTNKFHYQAWAGYTAQRNAAHDMATGDWILSLDADERVTIELQAEIKGLLSGRAATAVGYELPYKVFYRDKWLRHGGFFPEKHLRLFRRGHGRYGDRVVHETIQVDGPTGILNHYIEHYTYDSVSDFLERMERYSSLSAEEYARSGRTTGPVRMGGHALFNFFKMYILQRGFLDGYEGFLLATLYSFYTFVKYAKLAEKLRGPWSDPGRPG